MLVQLSIKNVAVIKKLDVDMKSGVSVLTGETGAGKSIIIDSINMILGNRTNKELVRYGEKEAMVQAVFEGNKEAVGLLEENDIECEENEIIIQRRITADGKSMAKINGIAVPLVLLREISTSLINIHGQHDNQALLAPSKHILFLDSYGGHDLEPYKKEYAHTSELYKEIEELRKNEQEKLQRLDLLKYQINEIEKARLSPGEEEDLSEQREIAQNAEKISENTQTAYVNLYDGGEVQSAYDGISLALGALEEIKDFDSALKNAYDGIQNAMYIIEDAAHEINDYSQSVSFDEGMLNDIEERLDLINRLKRKYGRDIPSIIEYMEKAKKEAGEIESSDERLERLKEEYRLSKQNLMTLGKALSEERKKSAKKLGKMIEDSLRELDMPSARFEVCINQTDGFTKNGIDNVEFMISANPGEPLKPMAKIASGGELSRVMLAMKAVLADADNVDTLIFDEIDTGVSGKAARKIALKLKQIGAFKQVICITHLPQLAAAGDNHYLIQKHTDGESVSTTLTELGSDEREKEIARIIDGEITELALKHAKEMLGSFG